MPNSLLRPFLLLLLFATSAAPGCTAWQPTKEVWKTTKGLWRTYVSPPAEVDYADKGSTNPEAFALSSAIIGIDAELAKLERTMQNADRPPTQEWLANLFAGLPWLNGFAGVKYDGTILGQEPPGSPKELDFVPLLYEDKKQGSRALRTDVQPSPLGPEVMLATPLYDGIDFLGIVVAYFDMRSLMRFSDASREIVVLCPGALLWPGKYDFAATPLAGVQWEKVVLESTAGTCSNANGTFHYMVRYLGNMPMVFAIAAKGNFPEGSGNLEQGNAYFPQAREKLPPPPQPEHKRSLELAGPIFEKPAEPAPAAPETSERDVIQQGSRESVLIKRQRQASRHRLRERGLEGEDVPYQPTYQPGQKHQAKAQKAEEPELDLIPDSDTPKLSGGRPSPFGPKGEDSQVPEAAAVPNEQDTASGLADGEKETEAEGPDLGRPYRPDTLPGGRPSPFGPRN